MKIVSIIITVYNKDKYIEETIMSALGQTLQEIEIIVVNDGSTDGSREIICNLVKQNPQIKFIDQENQGVIAARNVALREAKGKYIFPLDGDDKISPDCLELLLNAMIEKNADLVYCDVEFFGDRNQKFNLPEPTKENMMKDNCITASALYKKDLALKYGGYDSNMRKGLEDWEFWWNFLTDNKKIYKVSKVLFFYRYVANSRNYSFSDQDREKMHQYIANKHHFWRYTLYKRVRKFLFHKTKSLNGRRRIYFCGIKFFSYKRKKTIQQRLNEQNVQTQNCLREQNLQTQHCLNEQNAQTQNCLREQNLQTQHCLNEQNAHLLRLLNEQQTKTQQLQVEINIQLENLKNIIAVNQNTEFIKTRISQNKKIRVGFIVNMCSMFPARAIFEEMMLDANFDAKLVVAPDCRFGKENEKDIFIKTSKQLEELYGATQIFPTKDINGECIDVIEHFDIICMATPYDISYPVYNHKHFIYSRLLTFHVDYGFLRSVYDRSVLHHENYSLFWRVFTQTPQNLEEIREHALIHGHNAIVTGYAKMDSLAKYKRTSTKKTIIIATHHSIEGGFNDILALSNFIAYHELFLQLPQKYPQIDFILRPHPALFFALVQTKTWTEQQCEAYKAAFLINENTSISEGGEYFQDFVNSDGIINDCGSYLVEYFYTQKPQLYLLKKPEDIQNKFTTLGQECLENCYVGYTSDSIINFIDDIIIQGADFKKHQRETFASNKIMLNYKQASKKCIEIIKQELM